MKMLLLDTNIISYYQRNDSRAKKYDRHIAGYELAISSMTVAELYQWAAVHKWGVRRINELEHKLEKNYTHLSIDWETCRLWRIIRAECRAIGHTISPQDAWIAATARRYDLPLVTHNLADFTPVRGLRVITEVKS